MSSPAVSPAAVTVGLVDVDEPLASLFEAWMAERGWRVAAADSAETSVLVVDVPYPRQASQRLLEVARRLPQTPVVAIVPTSSQPTAACCGAAVRELGVAAAVATPVRRDALLAAIEDALARR